MRGAHIVINNHVSKNVRSIIVWSKSDPQIFLLKWEWFQHKSLLGLIGDTFVKQHFENSMSKNKMLRCDELLQSLKMNNRIKVI